MGSGANYHQAPVHWPREITKAKLSQAKSFFIHIFLSNNGKRGKFGQFWAGLGNFGQVWASWYKFGQGSKLEKMGKMAERIRKENKNLSGNREGGGESRV